MTLSVLCCKMRPCTYCQMHQWNGLLVLGFQLNCFGRRKTLGQLVQLLTQIITLPAHLPVHLCTKHMCHEGLLCYLGHLKSSNIEICKSNYMKLYAKFYTERQFDFFRKNAGLLFVHFLKRCRVMLLL